MLYKIIIQLHVQTELVSLPPFSLVAWLVVSSAVFDASAEKHRDKNLYCFFFLSFFFLFLSIVFSFSVPNCHICQANGNVLVMCYEQVVWANVLVFLIDLCIFGFI